MRSVGYSDVYRTEWGFVGGYIIRNTWKDGLGVAHGLKGRGSHSMPRASPSNHRDPRMLAATARQRCVSVGCAAAAAFFMQQMTDVDEARICPNPHSPRSWTQCGSFANCASAVTRMEAVGSNKVLELACLDMGLPDGSLPKGACVPGDGYYLANLCVARTGRSPS
jgi:hypothetical protein